MTILNSQTIANTDTGATATANATVGVNQGQVLGASTVSTGLTNNFLTDSFFLPLLVAIIGIWLWRSGTFGIRNWITSKSGTLSEKKLQSKIMEIREREAGK